jgi:hypothetical protein
MMHPAKKSVSKFAAAPTKKGAPSCAKACEKKTAGAGDASPRTLVTEKERHGLIAQAAYLAAARRAFQGGSPEQDWLQAEAEIDGRLLRCEQSSNS